jgi:hypothetical protein
VVTKRAEARGLTCSSGNPTPARRGEPRWDRTGQRRGLPVSTTPGLLAPPSRYNRPIGTETRIGPSFVRSPRRRHRRRSERTIPNSCLILLLWAPRRSSVLPTGTPPSRPEEFLDLTPVEFREACLCLRPCAGGTAAYLAGIDINWSRQHCCTEEKGAEQTCAPSTTGARRRLVRSDMPLRPRSARASPAPRLLPRGGG